MNVLDELDAAQLRTDVPDFRPGDTLDVGVRVVEGNRSRVQRFKGVVIRRQGDGLRETFTVRKESFGVGVERTFPVHTPVIEDILVVTRGDVRRAKLYYLRELRGKKAKIKEKRSTVPSTKGSARTAPADPTASRRAAHRGAVRPCRSLTLRRSSRSRLRHPTRVPDVRLA